MIPDTVGSGHTSTSYFDKACLWYKNQPFQDARAKADFAIPLRDWGDAKPLEMRRRFYRVNHFFMEDELESQAPFSCQIGSVKVYLFRNPINQFEVDAVINPANETLLGGGGADEEIHSGAGPNLVKECAYLHGCEVGEAKITKGYDLPAKYVIHTVGPLLNNDGSPNINDLAKCYRNCFDLCEKYHLKSIAAPCIACGFYAFPVDISAQLVKAIIVEICHRTNIEKIILSVPKESEWDAYYNVFSKIK